MPLLQVRLPGLPDDNGHQNTVANYRSVYASHTASRGSLDTIANQEIGYSHPLGRMADILFGGGRCSFYPRGHSRSCRSDNVDLWKYAEEEGYYIARNLSDFEALDGGNSDTRLP